MEGNGYLMPLRNNRRYTPYEFDLKMSQNEERMNRLGKIIDQDIFYSLISHRKTPSVTTGPNYVVENKKEYNPLNTNINLKDFNRKNEITYKNSLMEVSNNSFKIPRSPRYDTINQTRRFMDQEQEILNNDRRFRNNNQNERFMDEQINNYRNRNDNNNNDFNEYSNENNYPRMMNNQNNNPRNNMRFNEFNNEMRKDNRRYNDYEEPRRFNNYNFRSQEISKTNNYNVPRNPMNYEEEGNYMNNRYKNSFRERMNDIDLNDMKFNNDPNYFNKKNQRYGKITNSPRRFYNSQLNFPPKEEEY